MNNNYTILNATQSDIDELLALYKTFYGGPAGWNSEYPNIKTIEFDLQRNCLYVMKNEKGEIVATTTVDDDKEAEELDVWNPQLKPSVILSRICVRQDMQNQGIARVIMSYVFEELKKQGKKGVQILIHKGHIVAMKSYAHLDFILAGECELDGVHYICMEREI